MTPSHLPLNECPRCGSKKVIDLLETIECLECKLEFEKEEILSAPSPQDVLSIQEKMKIAETLFFDK